ERGTGVTRSSQDLEGAAQCDPQNPCVGDLSRPWAGGAFCDMEGRHRAASTDHSSSDSPGPPVVHSEQEFTAPLRLHNSSCASDAPGSSSCAPLRCCRACAAPCARG